MKKHILSKLKTDQRGQALLIALVFMLLGSLIVTPLLSHMATGLKTGKEVYEKRMDELYAADAGVEDALYQLQQTPPDSNKVPTAPGPANAKTYGYGTAYPLADVNGKHVTVIISMQDSTRDTKTYWITSTATLNSSTTSIVSYVSITRSGGLLFNNAITTLGGGVTLGGSVSVISYPEAKAADVFSSGGLTIGSNCKIEGDVYAKLNISGGGTIDGNATTSASGTDPIPIDANVTGTPTSAAPVQSPGQLTQAQITTIVRDVYNETYNIGTLTPTGSPPEENPIKNKGTSSQYKHYTNDIYVTGDIEFQFSKTNYVVFDKQVYCTGSMTFKDTQNVIFNGAVYVGGSLTSDANAGRIDFNKPLTVAGSIDGKGSCPLYFNDNVKVLGNLTTSSQCQVSFGGGIYVDGSLTLGGGSGINLKSDVYVGGNMTLSGGAEFIDAKEGEGEGIKVVVQGASVKMAGGTNVLAAEQLPFILAPTAATVDFNGGATVHAVIYAPQAEATKNGSGIIYGALITKSLNFQGGSTIEYDTDLKTRDDLNMVVGSGLPRVITWDISTQ